MKRTNHLTHLCGLLSRRNLETCRHNPPKSASSQHIKTNMKTSILSNTDWLTWLTRSSGPKFWENEIWCKCMCRSPVAPRWGTTGNWIRPTATNPTPLAKHQRNPKNYCNPNQWIGRLQLKVARVYLMNLPYWWSRPAQQEAVRGHKKETIANRCNRIHNAREWKWDWGATTTRGFGHKTRRIWNLGFRSTFGVWVDTWRHKEWEPRLVGFWKLCRWWWSRA